MSDRPNTDTDQTTQDVNAILAGMALPQQLQPGYRSDLPPGLLSPSQLPPELRGTVVPPGTFRLTQADPANPPPTPATTPSPTPGGDQPLASPTPPTPATPASPVPGGNAPMLQPTPPVPPLPQQTTPGVWQDRPGAFPQRPGQQPQLPQQQQNPTETQQRFIETYGPLAEQVGQQLGVDPRLILGQWALESGWGVGPGAAQIGNMAGIKGRDGQYVRFNSPQEFADAYTRFLRDNPRYRGAIGAGTDAGKFFGALKQAGYFGADLGPYMGGVLRNIGVFGTVAQGQGPQVQPQQSYVPTQPRDAEDWGHPPPVQGAMGANGMPQPGGAPQQSDFGRIMTGLAPLLVGIASLAVRMPLSSAILAYGATAKSIQNGQREEYERNRTIQRDKLAESTAQQTMESRAASDAFSEYGHNNPQGLQQRLMQIALENNDPVMYRMAERGDLNGIYQMQAKRDALNQDLTRLHKAQDEEQQRQDRAADVAARDRQWDQEHPNATPEERAIAHAQHRGEAERDIKGPTTGQGGEEAPVYNVIDKATGKVTRQVRVGRNGGAFDLNGQPTTIDPTKEELQPLARPVQPKPAKPTPANPYVQPGQDQPDQQAQPDQDQSGQDQQDQSQPDQAQPDQDQGAASQAPAGPVQTAAAQPAAQPASAPAEQFAPYQVAQAGAGIQPPPSTAQPAQTRAAPGMGPRMSALNEDGRRLARDYAMNGNEALQDVPAAFRTPLIQAGQELRSEMEGAAQSGLTGNALDKRLHQIDPTFADYLKGVSAYTNDLPTPGRTGSTGGRIMALSIAQKLNPNFSEQNLPSQRDFRRPGGITQRTLSRAAVMAESARQVREYLKALPADPGMERWKRAWDQFVNNKLVGDHRYSDLFVALRQYIQEANVLVRGGQESVTETGEQLGTREGGGLFGGAAFAMPGNATPGMILGLLKTDARNVQARMDNFRRQWRQQDGQGEMPGDDPDAYRTFRELGDMDVDKEAGVASDSDIEKFLGR